MRLQSHPRYRLMRANSLCDGEIPFVIFLDERRLRSHVLKHFSDSRQWEIGWGKLVPDMKFGDVVRVIDKLKDIGCSWTSKGFLRYHPCLSCRLFERCSLTGITELEKLYVNIIETSLERALKEPRYTRFRTHEDQERLTSLIVGPAVVIRTSLLWENTYNVMTALVPCMYQTMRLYDVFANEVEKVKEEAIGASIYWCTEETWGINSLQRAETPAQSTPGRKRRRFIYAKETSNWRKYLDEYINDETYR